MSNLGEVGKSKEGEMVEANGQVLDSNLDAEEDPLVVAQREREELEKALEEAKDVHANDDPELKAFYADMKEVDRENQVNRVLGAFKLNPYEMLDLRFDASMEDVPKQYRKISLAVHPDKCTHPRARDAFEIIGHAQKQLLNEEKKKSLDFLLATAKDKIILEWKKAAKHDAASRLALAVSSDGVESLEEKWIKTPEFHEAWKTKARDILAQSEWRKRKMEKRIKNETDRAKEEHQKKKEEMKKSRKEERAWEDTREDRVGSWRSFMTKKSKKSKGGSMALGGLKPPKAKRDEDKSYIYRPAGQ